MRIGRGRSHTTIAGDVESLVAPQRLHRERSVIIHGNIRETRPRAFVAVFASLRVVPTVLNGGKIVRVGDRFGVLVSGDNAVAVEDTVAKAIAGYVHGIHSAAAGAEARPDHIEKWDKGILQAVRIAEAVHTARLRVVTAINGLPRSDGSRRRENDVGGLWIISEVTGR